MKNIYFIDEHNSSRQNGIGTFRDQLLPRLATFRGIRVTLISLNSDVKDFCRRKRDFGTEICIPLLRSGDWRQSGGLICPVLRSYIKDLPENVFVVNHSPCVDFIKFLRESFPLSKVIFIVHDQGWCTALLGSKHLLHEIVVENKIPEQFSNDVIYNVRKSIGRDREIYNSVDRVVCLSPSTYEILQNIYGVNREQLCLIPNGYESNFSKKIEKSDVRSELGINLNDKIILFAGRPAVYKGIEPTLRALQQLVGKYPEMRCVFCGNIDGFGKFSSFLSPIASKLIFTGQLLRSDLFKWYSAADIGLMPSYSEQCSYSAMEMADAGLLMVTSNGNGLCDMFKDNENAFVAVIGDVTRPEEFSESLAEKVDAAFSAAPETISRLIDTARMKIHEIYSSDLMACRYVKLLGEL